jgi:hypothetical protein
VALTSFMQALSAALLMNVCIVGINQVSGGCTLLHACVGVWGWGCEKSEGGVLGAKPYQSVWGWVCKKSEGGVLGAKPYQTVCAPQSMTCAALQWPPQARLPPRGFQPPTTPPHPTPPHPTPPHPTPAHMQIYDVEIDRVNKPYLPLAAGDFSTATASWIVWLSGAASLGIGLASGSPPLLCTLGASLALGIAYSTELPLLRWKRFPLVAAACILAVRSVGVGEPGGWGRGKAV